MLECVCALMCLQARNAAATAPPQGYGGGYIILVSYRQNSGGRERLDVDKHEIPMRSPVLDAYVRVQKKKKQCPLRSNIEIPRFTLFKFCFVLFLFFVFNERPRRSGPSAKEPRTRARVAVAAATTGTN